MDVDLSDEPTGLSARGRALWDAVTDSNELDPGAKVILAEACRIVDRLESLHSLLGEDHSRWIELAEEAKERFDTTYVQIVVDNCLQEARQQQLALRQILTTLGLGRADPKADGEEDLFTRLDKQMHPEKYAVG